MFTAVFAYIKRDNIGRRTVVVFVVTLRSGEHTPDTAAHIPFRELSVLFSEYLLRGKALREAALLLCKQGVAGSIPATSTKSCFLAGSSSAAVSTESSRSASREHGHSYSFDVDMDESSANA
jgi:hypothetical protein